MTALEEQAVVAVRQFLGATSNAPHRDELVQFVVAFSKEFGLKCVGKVVLGEVARTAVQRAELGEA